MAKNYSPYPNANTNNNHNSEHASAKMFFKKSKSCALCAEAKPVINYKNPTLLEKFISEGGRMLPSRITNVCAKHQRALKRAIRHSRILALLPFVFADK